MMLSCTDVRDLFSLYLDGELEEEKACGEGPSGRL